jgi:hypothetical protein
MFTCDDFLLALCERDGGQNPGERAAFEVHRASCPSCQKLVSAHRTALEAKAHPETAPRCSPDLKARVLAYAEARLKR